MLRTKIPCIISSMNFQFNFNFADFCWGLKVHHFLFTLIEVEHACVIRSSQNIEVLAPMDKQHRLEQILRSQEPDAKVIIFCTTKRMCDQLARSIDRRFGAVAIHGDKSQSERDWVLSQFRSGRAPILVATDVAARGLDIKDIRF